MKIKYKICIGID